MARLLFLDDDVLTLQLMEKITSFLGHEALLSTSIADAFVCAQEKRPDIILVDLSLQEMSGLAFIKQVRSHLPELRNTPMFVVSAGRTLDDEKEALRAGAAGYIRKPVSLDELSSIIRKHNGKKLPKNNGCQKPYAGLQH